MGVTESKPKQRQLNDLELKHLTGLYSQYLSSKSFDFLNLNSSLQQGLKRALEQPKSSTSLDIFLDIVEMTILGSPYDKLKLFQSVQLPLSEFSQVLVRDAWPLIYTDFIPSQCESVEASSNLISSFMCHEDTDKFSTQNLAFRNLDMGVTLPLCQL